MSLDINLTNVQSTPIVVNANTTAENNKVYHVIANATFTDPTPVEGRGYVVLLVNGTFSFLSSGNTFSQRGTLVFRQFLSGSWYTLTHDERSYNANTFVPQTRTINGLDLSANRTLTTANINDSTNKRYVTDAQLTVLSNTSGTNTGDQNLSGLVPYTGATADVDLDTFGLDAKFIKIKGTGGNGHLNLKHQSSDATAGGSESVLYADNLGNPKWKNDGNAVQNVMLENSAITGATKTKITYDAKGLVTSGTDATTADIADSSNKRYVTDAQLTVLGNTSNTNTGDETKSSILSKLGVENLIVTGDQTTTSTTAVNITDLVTTTLTTGKYKVNGTIGVGSNSTTGIKLGIVIPTGATMKLKGLDRGSTFDNSITEIFTTSNTLSTGNFCRINGESIVNINGTITIGATSGVVQFIFAKTTSGTATINDEGTQITIEKL